MDSNFPASSPKPAPSDSVLGSGRAKKVVGKKYWSGGGFMWIGFSIIISGALMSITIGGNFARACILLGLALFLTGLAIDSAVTIIKLFREKKS